jgi:hypothetical protein
VPSYCELDTHADTCCIGKGAYLIAQDTNNHAEVTGFSHTLGTVTNVPIINAALAYDCNKTFQTYILIFNQALYMEDMARHLICPNQLRMNGIVVNDCPSQFVPKEQRTKETHSIITETLSIPLELRGVFSCFQVRCPTQAEMDDVIRYPQIQMTSDHPWDPYDDQFEQIETSLFTVGLDYHTSMSSNRSIDVLEHDGYNLHQNSHELIEDTYLLPMYERFVLVTESTSTKSY